MVRKLANFFDLSAKPETLYISISPSRVVFSAKASLKEKWIQVEKYVHKTINNKQSVIEIHMLQTIVGNICQEISQFNFVWTISFFPAR